MAKGLSVPIFVSFMLVAPLLAGGAGCRRQDGVKLKVANWAGPEGIAIEEANLEEFRQAHPHVRVTLEPIPRDYQQKILTSIAGGTAPDVFLLDAITVPDFIEAGALLDLSPYVERVGIDLSDFYPHILGIAERGERLYAFPKDFTPMVIYYNKKLFAQANLDYPDEAWSWDDFLQAARKLTRDLDGDGRIDQYGVMPFTRFYLWPPWVWSNGGDFLDPSGRRASGYLDSPETAEALEFLLDLIIREKVAAGYAAAESAGDELGLFLSGRVAMAESGHWWMPQLKKAIEDKRLEPGIVALPIPPGGKHVTVFYQAGWAVSRQTEHPALAVQLAAFLSSVQTNRRRCEQGVAIPANRSLAEEIISRDKSGLEKIFFREVQAARAPWGARIRKANVLEKYAEEAFASALLEGKDLRQALQEAARKFDEALAAQY